MTKERPILDVDDEKVLKNTGTEQRPFWAKIGQNRRIRLFGILIFRHTSTGDFPDQDNKGKI
jgi:hypothetical protein